MKNALKPAGKRQLDHIRIYQPEGGFIAEHHFVPPRQKPNEPWQPNEPEAHVFTKGHELLSHVGKALGIKGEKGGKEEKAGEE